MKVSLNNYFNFYILTNLTNLTNSFNKFEFNPFFYKYINIIII